MAFNTVAWLVFLGLIVGLLLSAVAGVGEVAGATVVAAAKTFQIDRKYYPSPLNPNFMSEGTLVRSAKTGAVFYLRGGKRSWVLPSIFDRWTGENHFFKADVALTLSEDDLKRYPQTVSVNKLYIGKVLQHPDGTQYYIDDKQRKRKLSAGGRAALKFPAGNLYPTSAIHLQEFKTGPVLGSDKQPGGMVVYDGPFRGGRIWKIEEETSGTLVKRLYLSDYLYEADGYPDESQRVGVTTSYLARYPRAANIERYTDGWVVGLGTNIYVVQQEKLRLIASPNLLAALGYQAKYVLRVFPTFLQRYPKGEPIRAFKSMVTTGGAFITAAPAPNTANNLTRVRPAIRIMIASLNTTFLRAFDREPTVAENKFWVDYVYNGEVETQTDLLASMERAATTGILPSRTPRTTPISLELLKSKWLPYLFYFVHQREMEAADRAYWEGRIESDRDTIEKLGGTLQWLKDTTGQSRK